MIGTYIYIYIYTYLGILKTSHKQTNISINLVAQFLQVTHVITSTSAG